MTDNLGASDAGAVQLVTGSAVQFRTFDLSDKEEAVRLLSIGRPPAYQALKTRLFDWQFLRNPHEDGRSPFLVGELDGRMVALNGFMPARVHVHGKPIEAAWSCDTYVSGEHRGKGIGKQLIARVTASAPLMLGYGISDMSDPIFEKFDWRRHPGVELVFCHLAERGVRGKIKNAMSRVAALRSTRVQGAEYEVWDSLTPDRIGQLDELWARSAAGFPCAVQRDGAYLEWKYFEHPFYRYQAHAMQLGAQLTAVMIVRHSATEAVIADYSGPAANEDAISSLAAEIVHSLEETGTTRVKCESTHKPLITALKRIGFIASPHSSRFRIRVNGEAVHPGDEWLLMAGDSDGDLLVSESKDGERSLFEGSEAV